MGRGGGVELERVKGRERVDGEEFDEMPRIYMISRDYTNSFISNWLNISIIL